MAFIHNLPALPITDYPQIASSLSFCDSNTVMVLFSSNRAMEADSSSTRFCVLEKFTNPMGKLLRSIWITKAVKEEEKDCFVPFNCILPTKQLK